MRHPFGRLAAALAVALLIAVGCGGDDDQSSPGTTGSGSGTDTETTEGASGEADPSATLVLAQLIAPAQWDPHSGRSAVVDGSIMGPVYDRLLRINGELEIEPQLATSYEMSDDALSMTMELRDDVTFHDGAPFDANAVKANIEYAKSTQGTGAVELKAVESVEVVDAHTVTLHFSAPSPVFPTTLAYQLAAGGMVSPTALANPASLATQPAGSGPYELVQQTQDRTIYEKVDDYWDKELLARAPQRIELIQMADDNARLAALQSGQIDAMVVSDPVPNVETVMAGDIELFTADPNVRNAFVAVNFSNPTLANPLVRKAMNLALDREAIAPSIFDDTCPPDHSPFTESVPGYNPDATEHEYNPDEAKRLLEESGATNLSFNMLHLAQGLHVNLATAIQAQFAEVGIELNLSAVPSAQSQPEWRSGKYDLFSSIRSGLPDPSLMLVDSFLGANMPGGTDPELQAMYNDFAGLPLDSADRVAGLEDVAAYLADNPVNIIVCHPAPQILYKEYVAGIEDQTFNQISSAFDTRNLYVKPH